MAATIRAMICFRNIIAELHEREEQELRAFKTVHMIDIPIQRPKSHNKLLPLIGLMRLVLQSPAHRADEAYMEDLEFCSKELYLNQAEQVRKR